MTLTPGAAALPHPLLRELAARHGTPLWIYRADTIRSRIELLRAFDTVRYAQKANANLHVLRLMRAAGVQVDAVSAGELLRALAAGYAPHEIVFTADLFTHDALALVVQHGIAVNAGSIDMLAQLGAASPGHAAWLRINPGFGHGHSRKTNTGGTHSKHGIWHTKLPAALAALRTHGLKLVGLHMHIGSGVDYAHLARVGGAMVDLVRQVVAAGHDLHALSAGGGLSTPYRADEARVDTAHYHAIWHAARREAEALVGHALALEIEPGRFLVAEAGALLTEVRAVKRVGAQRFVLVDAGFNELVRPAMYGAHHEMTLLPATPRALGAPEPTVVAGPLCESGDVFTQNARGEIQPLPLPPAQVGDWLLIHDAGAYGASMSSQYNSRPLAAEVMVDGDTARLVRRRQSMAELLALEAMPG